MSHIRHFLQLLLKALPSLVFVVILSFLLMKLAPGDVVDFIAAESGTANAETSAALRSAHGLDQPVLVQLWHYLGTLAGGSLGVSMRYNQPVVDLILERLPATLQLVSLAILVAAVLGVTAGTLMAGKPGGWRDRLLTLITLFFYSLPSFWVALVLMIVFSVLLGWLPSGGAQSLGKRLAGLDLILDRARYLVLPITALALYYIAIYARLTRASVLEMRRQDYVRTAVAKGLSGAQVTLRHVLRNALIPVTTLAGMHVSGILGGAVVIETIFAWPGMGRLTYEAILARDYVLLLGILQFSAVTVIVVNILVEMLHSFLDPRIDSRQEAAK